MVGTYAQEAESLTFVSYYLDTEEAVLHLHSGYLQHSAALSQNARLCERPV